MTMNKQEATAWCQKHAAAFVGKNCRQYFASAYIGTIGESALGFPAMPGAFEGTVMLVQDGMALIKKSPNKFHAIALELLTETVSEGDKVAFDFYKSLRFDGTASDGSDDPSVDGVKTYSLGFSTVLIPVRFDRPGRNEARITSDKSVALPSIQNPYLIDLVLQLEGFRVNQGMRNIAGVICDAGAKNLRFNDPLEENSMDDLPAIVFDVRNEKIEGTVSILYRRVPDCYEITIETAGVIVEKREELFFDDLGKALVEMIDDQQWLKAKTTVLKRAPKKKAA